MNIIKEAIKDKIEDIERHVYKLEAQIKPDKHVVNRFDILIARKQYLKEIKELKEYLEEMK